MPATDAFPNMILWLLFSELTKLIDSSILYGYLGLVIGFGITALLLIALPRGCLGYQAID